MRGCLSSPSTRDARGVFQTQICQTQMATRRHANTPPDVIPSHTSAQSGKIAEGGGAGGICGTAIERGGGGVLTSSDTLCSDTERSASCRRREGCSGLCRETSSHRLSPPSWRLEPRWAPAVANPCGGIRRSGSRILVDWFPTRMIPSEVDINARVLSGPTAAFVAGCTRSTAAALISGCSGTVVARDDVTGEWRKQRNIATESESKSSDNPDRRYALPPAADSSRRDARLVQDMETNSRRVVLRSELAHRQNRRPNAIL